MTSYSLVIYTVFTYLECIFNTVSKVTYGAFLAREAEEHVGTVSLRHLSQHIQQFGGVSRLKQKVNM